MELFRDLVTFKNTFRRQAEIQPNLQGPLPDVVGSAMAFGMTEEDFSASEKGLDALQAERFRQVQLYIPMRGTDLRVRGLAHQVGGQGNLHAMLGMAQQLMRERGQDAGGDDVPSWLHIGTAGLKKGKTFVAPPTLQLGPPPAAQAAP